VTRRRGVKPSAFVQFTSSTDLDDYQEQSRNKFINSKRVNS